MVDLRRRQFITLLGGTAATWPLAALAQQSGKIPRIGIIDDAPRWNAFRHGLRDLGYANLSAIDYLLQYLRDPTIPPWRRASVAMWYRRPSSAATALKSLGQSCQWTQNYFSIVGGFSAAQVRLTPPSHNLPLF
jgi:hypothetical protein